MVKRKIIQFCTALLYNGNMPGFWQGKLWQGSTKSVCLPGLNCYSCPGALGACPVGALQSSLSGVFLRFPFYVIGTLLLFGLLLGRLICGWACPFGLIQELLYKLPTPKIHRSAFTAQLAKLKYLIAFVFVLLLPIAYYLVTGTGVPAFCKFICPAGTLEAALPLTIVNENLRSSLGALFNWKLLLMLIILGASVFIYRPFCRFLCPLGAFYSFFQRISLFGIKVDAAKCIHCNACMRKCLMDCRHVGDRECIACGECRNVCPTNAISIGKKL